MRQAYHREDLRRELVEAAYLHVTAHGHDELSVRKLAQLVKVSSAAPYHHFADRRSVLIAVAERGFQALRTEIGAAAARAEEPYERLMAASHAFFDFAQNGINMFELMFDSELTRPALDPQVEDQYRQTYAPILADFAQLRCTPEEAAVRVQIYWSTIFGFAFLSARGMRGRFAITGLDPAKLREAVIRSAIGLDARTE